MKLLNFKFKALIFCLASILFTCNYIFYDINFLVFSNVILIAFIIGSYHFLSANILDEPWYYFFILFFILFLAGPFLSMVFLGSAQLPFYINSTFSNGVSDSSIYKTFYFSLIFIATISFFIKFNTYIPIYLKDHQSAILLISFFFYLLASIYMVDFILNGNSDYKNLYVDGNSSLRGKIFSLMIFSYILLISYLPSRKQYISFFCIMMLIYLAQAYEGYRGGLFIFSIVNIFLFSRMYGGLQFRVFRSATLVSIAIFALFYFEIRRSGLSEGLDISLFLPFIFSSLSKGSYITSIYIENSQIIDEINPHTLLYPFYFIVDYFVYGSKVVGQSLDSSLIRGDMNHVLSSNLNKGAYLSGAGIGSSFVAEFYQLKFLIFPLTFFFYQFYNFFFMNFFKSRLFFIFGFFIFTHFILVARDTAFPFSFGFFRYFVFYIAAIFILDLLTTRRTYVQK